MKLCSPDKEILFTSYSRANTSPCLQHPIFTFRSSKFSNFSEANLDICICRLVVNARSKMDAGSTFLICCLGVFSLLLIGGWWFGYPLLMRFARRGTSRQHLCQSPQTRMGVAQDGQESRRSSGNVRGHGLSSWKHLTDHQSTTLPSDDQAHHSSRASPASSITSVFSGTKSSCSVHKAKELDILQEPHDLSNMIPAPPVPKRSLGRQVTEIGTQVSVLLPISWPPKVPLALAPF
jgi:hypothetical protein